jgi:LDH2 family malate/lactate/ureidoglycolate dehydrogenase
MISAASSKPRERVHLSIAEAGEISRAALMRVGYDKSDARIVTDHLIDAAACGYEYSGLPKILEVVEAERAKQPRRPVSWLRETPMSSLLDGGNNVGMISMHHATDRVIELAKAQGFGIVGVTRSWMSGRSAYYMERVARQGLIGFHTVSSASLVAPPGGARPSIGTNPIAFGFPGSPDPLIIDIGTSAIMGTEFGLMRRRGELLPEGVAIDATGKPTRDPEAARSGAFLTIAGHKGFALALAAKALGILAGSALNDAKDYGYLILAFKPELMMPEAEFQEELRDMLARVKATPKLDGVSEIRIPSERSFRERRRKLAEGIEIDAQILQAINSLGATR